MCVLDPVVQLVSESRAAARHGRERPLVDASLCGRVRVNELNLVIHSPHRLRICSMLSAVGELECAAVRDALDVADSVVSKHVGALADAGYVKIRKAPWKGRRRTWLSLTRAGRSALAHHVAALQEIIASAQIPVLED